MIKEFKDKLGREIKIRDMVVYGCGSNASDFAMVTRFTSQNVILGYGFTPPDNCLVITDLYRAEHEEAYQKMLVSYKDKFDDTPPAAKKVTPKYWLRIRMKGRDEDTCQLVLLINTTMKLEEEFESYDVQNIGKHQVRRDPNDKYSGWKSSGDATIVSYESDAKRALSAKMIRHCFGSVPVDSCILAEFDSRNKMQMYLQSMNIHGDVTKVGEYC